MDFITFTKLFLSSLSARACRYMYLNIPDFENQIILSNYPPDMIAEYKPQLCSIYIISPPEWYLNDLRVFLDIKNHDDVTLVFKTFFITKVLSNFDINNIKFQYNFNNGLITCTNKLNNENVIIKSTRNVEQNIAEEDDSEDEDKFTEDDKIDTNIFTLNILDRDDIAGSILNIPYVIECLSDMLSDMTSKLEMVLSDDTISNVVEHRETPEIEYVHANWYKNNIRTIPIERLNNRERFMLLIDGLDNPSIKEFIKKMFVKNNKYFKEVLFKQFTFLIDEGILQSMSFTILDDMEIITMRPYSRLILINK